MSQITFEGIGIKAISACVPPRIVKTAEQTKYFSDDQLSGFIATTGIDERRITEDSVTSSDLCKQAAETLFENLGGAEIKEKISCLLFVSQTPDYRMPNTACILQDKLGLSNKIFSLDINQACSGFVWGVMTAYSLCNSGFDNILLLVGDTPSKFLSPNDTSTSLMFGDAGTAILINKDSAYGKSFFSFNTDGSYRDVVYIPKGGYRDMSSPDGLEYEKDEDGNEKNKEQIHMDGLEVFSTSINVMTKDIKTLLAYAGMNIDDIDTVVLHQANRFMNKKISKKLGVDPAKEIVSIHKFGNTSCTSIPLNMAFNKGKFGESDKLLFEAIGASFTWGSAIINLSCLINCGVEDYKG